MPETAEPTAGEGQSTQESTGAKAPTGTTGKESGASKETTAAQTQTTQKGTEEETFFDPANLPDELKPAYKDMQRAFTKKTQSLKDQRHAVDAYNAFMKNPVGEMQRLAQQYGYQLTSAQAAQAAEDARGKGDWQPKSWQEVLDKAEENARAKILKEFEPMVREFQSVKKTQIEQQLDELVPDWRLYEEDMSKALSEHPTLVNDPVKLARLAIPDEVMKGRAAQEAIKKFQDKAKASQASGGSSTNKSAELTTPNKNLTFAESVEFAKKQLAGGA